MKKLLGMLLLMATLLCFFPLLAVGEGIDNFTSGFFIYTLKGGNATISSYTQKTKSLEMPDTLDGYPVVAIGNFAFAYNHETLEAVTIPDSITSIGDSAFENCKALKSIKIPACVTSIGESAFRLCEKLVTIDVTADNPAYASVKGVLFDKSQTRLIAYPGGKTASTYQIPKNVTEIGKFAFYGCSRLKAVKLADKAVGIGQGAFGSCDRLNAIHVLDGNSAYSSVNGVLFNKDQTILYVYPKGKAASAYNVPDGVQEIGEDAFWYCNRLTSIELPDSLQRIEKRAFYECRGLCGNIILPGNVKSIGEKAFYFTGIESISIPKKVTDIGVGAFWNCEYLTAIEIVDDNPTGLSADGVYTSADGVLFDKEKSVLHSYPMGKKDKAYQIPQGVKTIGDRAFINCRNLESITIPDSVTNIVSSALRTGGKLQIIVAKDSYAHQYAIRSNTPYILQK